MIDISQSEFVVIYKPSGISYISKEFRDFMGLSYKDLNEQVFINGGGILAEEDFNRIVSIFIDASKKCEQSLQFETPFHHPNGALFQAKCTAELEYDLNSNHTFGLVKFSFQYENGREYHTYQALQSSLEDRNKIIQIFFRGTNHRVSYD